MPSIVTDSSYRVIPFLIIRLVSFPHHHLSTDPAFTLTSFYVWTQTTLYVSLMVSTIPCLKPFVAGLNTGYGAFDTEHVATRAYGSYGGYAPGQRRIKRSSNLPSKSAFDLDEEPGNFKGDGIWKKRATVDGGVRSQTLGHYVRPSQVAIAARNTDLSLNSRAAGHHGEPGEGKVTNIISAVALDGNNSIGSNDSQQMIIRKDVAWAVEYSAP